MGLMDDGERVLDGGDGTSVAVGDVNVDGCAALARQMGHGFHPGYFIR